MGTYCDRTKVERVGGTQNVSNWAQIDPSWGATEITAQIAEAREWAYDEINLWMANSQYRIPLQTKAGLTPSSIERLAAELATVWLLEATGPKGMSPRQDGHILWARRERCYETLQALQRGKLAIVDAVLGGVA